MKQLTTKKKPKLFLDSAALCSLIISSTEGTPMERLVLLGEAGIVELRISREVVSDVERFVRDRNPASLPKVAEIMSKGKMILVPEPSRETIDRCELLTRYRPDARILAAAMECLADVLVTYDRTHLLGNKKIKPPKASVIVMEPQECLDWCFEQWKP